MWITSKVIVWETCFWEMILADFPVLWVNQKYFNFAPMIELQKVDPTNCNCSWDIFLWKEFGGLPSFMGFSNFFNLVPMSESWIVDHVKSDCSWDMFLKANSGGLHIFISFSNIFQLCTNARITKYGSREKYLFVRHVFVKRFWRTSQFHEFFKNILILHLHQNHEMWVTWKVFVREICFC